MALTITEGADSRQDLGFSLIVQFNKLQPGTSDYPAGGYPMYSSSGSATNAGQQFGLAFLHGVVPVGFTGTAVNYIWQFNKGTGKLQVFGISVATAGATIYTLTEVAANTDLSGGSVTVWTLGF